MRPRRGMRIFQSSDQGEGTVKAAIIVFDQTLDVTQYPLLTTNNIVVLGVTTKAWKITLVSLYFEPLQPIEAYLEHLTKIVKELGPARIIVGGDCNSKSSWWGSPHTDSRGEAMAGTVDELGLQVLNTGSTPTFDTIRGGKWYHSYVDITACSTDMLDLVEDWTVDETLTSSDHNGITFNIKLQKSKGMQISRTTRLYNTKNVNWSMFHEKFRQLKADNNLTLSKINQINSIENIEIVIKQFETTLTEACTITIPLKKTIEKLKIPWWSDRLAEMKKEVSTRKRRIRCAAPVRRDKVVQEYLEIKEKYEIEAKKAQVDSWKNFCERQDREGLWEGIYRVIGRTKNRDEDLPLETNGSVLDAKGSVKLLAEVFYPEDHVESDSAEHRRVREKAERVNDESQVVACDPPFTLTELNTAIQSCNPKKAPGADGFTADICAHAIQNDPSLFLGMLNKCLAYHHFPSPWKEATVIVLRKPGKTKYTDPKSYRPIGLLPVLGKIYERLLMTRIKYHLLPRMSTRQYGFMPQKSTEDSLYTLMQHIQTKLDQKKIVTLVSLDIEGAFDSAWWPAIRVRLAEEDCPVNLRGVIDSYLSHRRVSVRYAGEEFSKSTNKGCIQGSIGGPMLWNLLLDPLLKGLEKRGDYVQAFADDVVLVFEGRTALEVEGRANAALCYVQAWGVTNKLKFAPQKTNAMVITRKLKYDTPRLRMGGVGIDMCKSMKILGLIIDEKLTFDAHVAHTCCKALNIYKQLSRAAKIHWGLQPEIIRTIYMAVIEPIILYAASAWAQATHKLGIKKQFNTVQRGFAQKMIKAYRTVSLNSALLLAGLLPLDIRVREAAQLYEVKKGYSQRVVGDRAVETPMAFTDMIHPVRWTSMQFTCLGDGAALEQHYNQNGLNIFTDGSKIEGRVGAALSVWHNGAELNTRKFRLEQCCTVYQAELLALFEATNYALRSRESTSCNVYSDSRSALETVVNNTSLHPLAVKTRANIEEMKAKNGSLQLFWIKAHAGMEGNERADTLAKDAALHSKTRSHYDRCPISFVKRQIRLESLDEWNQRYKSGDTASTTKHFFPDAIKAFPIIRKIKIEHLIVQVMTGHGGFSSYLHRFKCKESPSCVCDPDVEESALHVITKCPVYGRERFDAEMKINETIDINNLEKIIANDETRHLFIEFCKQIAAKVVSKNKTN